MSTLHHRQKEGRDGHPVIDLALAIEAGRPSGPEMMIPRIDYVDHAQGAEQMRRHFPGLPKRSCPVAIEED